MGKIITYMGIIGTVLIGFHIAGLIQDTPSQIFISLINNPQSFQDSTLYQQIIAILMGVGGLGIVIGSFLGDRVQWALTTGLAILFLSIGWDILAIYNLIALTDITLAILLILPLFLMYILSVIEWWLGRD